VDRAATALGRVLDPEELEASKGPRAEHRITVPHAWGRDGVRLAVVLPKRLSCGRCHGGGCDGCHRSGALKGPEEPDARRVRFDLPRASTSDVAVRVCWPFGRDRTISQVIVEVRLGEEPSPNVERLRSLAQAVEIVRHAPRSLPATSFDLRLVGVLLVVLALSILLLTK